MTRRGHILHWALLQVVATVLMILVKKYPVQSTRSESEDEPSGARGAFYNTTATIRLLVNDSKMKYMIGLSAAFGFSGAFLDSFVNGEVVPFALHDSKASMVGLLVAVHGGAAAVASLVFGHMARITGKGPILYLGAACFAWVAIPFLIQPNMEQWSFLMLIGIYCLQGIGRATFEGTLKAVFADYFFYEKEGAYANIVLQNGISGAVAYVISARLTCRKVSTYCMEYRDGSLHNVGLFGKSCHKSRDLIPCLFTNKVHLPSSAALVVLTSLMGIAGTQHLFKLTMVDCRLYVFLHS